MSLRLSTLLFSTNWHWSSEIGLLLVRAVFGGAFAYHGLIALFEGPSAWHSVGEGARAIGIAQAPLSVGLLISLVNSIGGICLLLGFCSRGAAIVLGVEMALVAWFYAAEGLGKELVLYAVKDVSLFAMLALTGPGSCSLDQMRADRRHQETLNDPTTRFVRVRPKWLWKGVRRE